jgi:hypothetical protein
MTATTKPSTRRKLTAAAAPTDNTAAVNEAGSEVDPGNSASDPDLAAIMPDPANITLAGIPVRIRRLQTRELLLAIRILTTGMGAGLSRVDLTGSKEELTQTLIALLITAVPDAPDELIDLLTAIVEARNKEHKQDLADLMGNPPIDVTIDVITAVAAQEKDDLAALAGKARQLFGFAQTLSLKGTPPK